jgi:hypothetical protein
VGAVDVKGRTGAGHGPARSRRGSFAAGFRQRNPAVLAAAVLFAGLLVLVAQQAFVRGAFTAVPEGRFLRIQNDDYIHLAYKLAALKKDPPQGPTLYLFGGSGAMESIVSQRSLAKQLERDGAGEVEVISLAAHRESLAATLALVDNVPPGQVALAIGLTPMRFTMAPGEDAGLLEGKPIIMDSPRLEALGPELYGRGSPFWGLLPGMFDYAGAYIRERADAPFWGVRIPYAHHYWQRGETGALPLAKRRNVLAVLARDQRLYAENADYNFRVLREILRLAQERGFAVVLWDQPLNGSAAGPDWAGVVPAYRERAQALADEAGVPYIHPGDAAGLTDADFADLYHLLHHGRLKWQPSFSRQVTEAIGLLGGSAVAVPRGMDAPAPVPSATPSLSPVPRPGP